VRKGYICRSRCLRLESINSHIGSITRLIAGRSDEEEEQEQRQINLDVEQLYLHRTKRSQQPHFSFKLHYVVDGDAVTERDTKMRELKALEAQQKADKRKADEEAATAPRRRQTERQDRFARVPSRAIIEDEQQQQPRSGLHGTALHERWHCTLGSSCAHGSKGFRMCWVRNGIDRSRV